MATRINGNRHLADFMVKGVRYRKQFSAQIEAQEYEATVRAKLHRGEAVNKDDTDFETITIRELFDRAILDIWKGKANEPTATQHCFMMEKFFGSKTLITQIDTRKLYDFKRHCENLGNKPATVKLKLATFSKAYSYALECKWIKEKPAIPKVSVEGNERNCFFSEQEEQDILDYLEEINEDYFADFFMWQIDTGMRPSEARDIKTSQIFSDPELGYIVRLEKTKNNVARDLPLTRRAYIAYCNHYEKTKMWEHWTKERIRTVWDKVRNALGRKGDKDFIFYLCRHTCGSRLVQRTGNIALTRKWLGHKRIEQTLRYSHLDANSYLSGLNALEYGNMCSDKPLTKLSTFTDKTQQHRRGLKVG